MSKATGFRLDEDILPNLKKIAKEQERSVNWLVNNTLKNFIEWEKKKKKKNEA
jgi:predicted transcriptional regulator